VVVKPSLISWADYSGGCFNPALGCTPVSEGCQNCYAHALYARFGKDFSKVTYSWEKLRRMSTVRLPQYSPKRGAPHKPIIFPFDMTDLFHPDIPVAFTVDALLRMDARQEANWVVITKRIERAAEIFAGWESGALYHRPWTNIMLMVTAENQRRFDERVPVLLDCWDGPTGVCVEPMLASIDADKYLWPIMLFGGLPNGTLKVQRPALGWTICGAESGSHRRPFNPQWAVDLREQCKDAGVPFYYKQGSAARPGQNTELLGYGVVQEFLDGW